MIHTEAEGPVITLTLDAPEVKNAFNARMIADLGSAISDAALDETCRCLIITGASGTFCAGRDLGEAVDSSLEAILERERKWEAFSTITTIPEAFCGSGRGVCGSRRFHTCHGLRFRHFR